MTKIAEDCLIKLQGRWGPRYNLKAEEVELYCFLNGHTEPPIYTPFPSLAVEELQEKGYITLSHNHQYKLTDEGLAYRQEEEKQDAPKTISTTPPGNPRQSRKEKKKARLSRKKRQRQGRGRP